MHPGGVQVLMVDGSVRYVVDQVDRGVWHVMHWLGRESPRRALSIMASLSFFMFLAHTLVLRAIEATAAREMLLTLVLGLWIVVIAAAFFTDYALRPPALRLLVGLPSIRATARTTR